MNTALTVKDEIAQQSSDKLVATGQLLTSTTASLQCLERPSQNSDGSLSAKPRVYTDHSRDPILDTTFLLVAAVSHQDADGKSKAPTPFPQLVHRMVTEAKGRGFESIVSWRPHGRAFQIYNREKFEKHVMPL